MNGLRVALLCLLAAALVVGAVVSVMVGAAGIAAGDVVQALFAFDPSKADHLVIHDLRLPRTIAAMLVGSSLAAAGAVMQGVTRNPLASPSLLGLNAGAGLALAAGLALMPGIGFTPLIGLSFLGAFGGVLLVYGIASAHPGGMGTVRLALAGAAVSALLGAMTSILVIYTGIAQDILFYVAGGLQGVRWPQLVLALPWFAVGLVGAMAVSRSVTLLSLGNDVAAGLGQNVRAARLGCLAVTLLLAGTAVALAGGIGFIGLVVPHIARFVFGTDYRWVIPGAAFSGGLLLVVADLAARMVNPPYETPVGFVTALIGVPFFLWLARRA